MNKSFRKPIDFVRAGEETPPKPKKKGIDGPWLLANPRIKMQFNMRLAEPLHAKLKWLGENTPDSMHAIAMQAIEEAVNKRLRQMSDGKQD